MSCSARPPEAQEALQTAAGCVVRGEPLIEPYRDVWVLSNTGAGIVKNALEVTATLRRRGVLSYLGPDSAGAVLVVRQWLAAHDRISSGDYATLTGLTYAGARRVLERQAAEGLIVRGEAAGRNAHFLPGPALAGRPT